ncbi:DUF2635 domain-containing protein [Thalassolituus oleivorans]|jgi:hypothetical protein|uniref:DUF2635 domain-containing protein n=1 Tax=Thalassolituus oleivorans MIL-1 TaxID=1298593 RepID=M5DP69_9GAMM|nr:DUF2635 domain-containing protein [Thalassolituus oleivorans]CCU70937.1 hypothetical protein TOL_0498 [Thalassolituus oleivorans MIL-1]
MSDKLKVKPAEGVNVRRIENGKHIAAAGEEVPNNSFYRRRIKDGDLIDINAGKSDTKVAAKKELK